MNYIIFDLEATCWEGDRTRQNETIEIGAIKINEEKEIIDAFSMFVKPKIDAQLSDFCKQLTTISQEDIDRAKSYDEVIQAFISWINIDKDYMLCSWGFYDRKQLESDNLLYQLDSSWLEKHISLKHQYKTIKSLKTPVGMQTALAKEKLTLDGTHHRGIDDARNIAKIFLAHFGSWQIEP
jgi:3'-5' exoribonuclease 1